MDRSIVTVAAAGLGALVCLSSSLAQAGNTEHPRTPVLWPEAPCIQTVDRAADPLFVFDYAIPLEDTFLSVDEFEDSRTHQFIGFCRQWPAGQPPPRYISVFDLERAIEAGFEQVVELDNPESTLETSAVWAGCWTRITADDARRPITYAAADEPVVWDTSGIAAGTWLVAGYTWEPQYNLWSRAPWVVRVLDGAEQPVQAAGSIADTNDALYFDESLEIPLCVDAMAGSSVTLEWTANDADPALWSAVASAEIRAAGAHSLSLIFEPPEPSWGATVLLRATIDQPEGADYAAHALAPVIVYKPSGDGDESGDDGETDESGDGDDSEESESGADESDTGAPGSGGDRDAGAGRCSLAPERGNLAGLLFGLLLLASAGRRCTYPAPPERLR